MERSVIREGAAVLMPGLRVAASRSSNSAPQAAAQQVHGFARSLSQQGNVLEIEVGKFLETVRAA
jgi:hypothetical protein